MQVLSLDAQSLANQAELQRRAFHLHLVVHEVRLPKPLCVQYQGYASLLSLRPLAREEFDRDTVLADVVAELDVHDVKVRLFGHGVVEEQDKRLVVRVLVDEREEPDLDLVFLEEVGFAKGEALQIAM